MHAHRDVTILGAGIFGLSTAWACLKRGARVRVIDPCGVAAGASGGLVGALAPHTPDNWNAKKQVQLESLLMAEQFWHEVKEVSGQSPGYIRSGRLQPIMDARALALANSRIRGAEDLWGGRAIWRLEDVGARGPWAPPSPTGTLIFDTMTAHLHPRQACTALAGAIVVRGGEIVTEGVQRGHVVHATGYQGLLEMSAKLGRPLGSGVKGQALLLEHDARGAPQLFVDGLHIVPHLDEGTVAIGSTSERDFTAPASTDALLDDVHARAVAALPVLRGSRILARWAGVRPRSKSRAPIMGLHPYRRDEFVLNGGFKIGFGMAPKLAELMADLILEGRDAIPESFRIEGLL